MSHVFAEADDDHHNHNSGANSANQEHPDQNVIQGLQKQMHSKSVLPTLANA